MRAAFATFDTNNDGFLDREEVMHALMKFQGWTFFTIYHFYEKIKSKFKIEILFASAV
jgi:Ca2+-binding EF-hand superfamily protein